MQFEDIVYEKKDGIAKITINRPQIYNALRTHSFEELTSAVRDAADDEEIGVIVITGAGEKAFSSGGDVNAQKERTSKTGRRHFRRMAELSIAMRGCGKPII